MGCGPAPDVPFIPRLVLAEPRGTDPGMLTVADMRYFTGRSGHGRTSWHTQVQAHLYTGSNTCQDTGHTCDRVLSAQTGFPHLGTGCSSLPCPLALHVTTLPCATLPLTPLEPCPPSSLVYGSQVRVREHLFSFFHTNFSTHLGIDRVGLSVSFGT